MSKVLIPIVEGQSEVESAGVLLRRMIQAEGASEIDVARPFRVKRNKVVREEELENALKQSTRARAGAAAVLVLLDADDDCAAELAPKLEARARHAIALPVAVVLAETEFESWLLGAKESLRGVRGIAQDATAPPDPQQIRDAKGRLSANMTGNRRYIPVDDQPALVAAMDLTSAAQRCSSFAKLTRAVRALIDALQE